MKAKQRYFQPNEIGKNSLKAALQHKSYQKEFLI